MVNLSLKWAVPFILSLLSIAFCPFIIKDIWEKHSFKILLIFPIILGIAITNVYGISFCAHEFIHSILEHYIPLIVLLFALFTVTGGIVINIEKSVTPFFNAGMLFVASLLAGWIGTTGASMLFIRPLINLNKGRKNITHIIIFFIFLVANIGGGFTPLGDPPLFMGFLEGVDFFWTIKNIGLHVLVSIIVLTSIFLLIDSYMFRKENTNKSKAKQKKINIKFEGLKNIPLLILIIAAVILSGIGKQNLIKIFGIDMSVQSIIRDVFLFVIGIYSLKTTSDEIHKKNNFNFIPLKEVAEIFIVIFLTLIPVSYILKEGANGAFSGFFNWVSSANGIDAMRCFFGTGSLSSFLDNAPTYLIFFNLSSGDAGILMTTLSNVLKAISLGSVFWGAVTYIGNAPNIMVRSIAEQEKINMPSFIGYMGWSFCILIPYFFLLSYICFN